MRGSIDHNPGFIAELGVRRWRHNRWLWVGHPLDQRGVDEATSESPTVDLVPGRVVGEGLALLLGQDLHKLAAAQLTQYRRVGARPSAHVRGARFAPPAGPRE